MRIVHIIPDLSYGGVPKICIDLVNFLSETNDVFLISLCEYREGMLPIDSIDSKIHFICFNKKKGFNKQLMWTVYKKLRKLKPDILHLHSVGLFYSVLYILTFPKAKIFYTVHTLAEKDAPSYYKYLYKWLFRFFRVKAIPISMAVQKSFNEFYHLNCGQEIYHGVNIIPNGIANETFITEIAKYKRTFSTYIFITLARIAEEKNQKLLIESFNRLIESGSNVSLLIIGGSIEEALLEELKMFAGPNIFFLGPKNDVKNYLKLADAFCLTSVYEGLSLATIEALAMKVIPICTPVGGVPEVVRDGYNGILSEDCTIASYVNALNRFLTMSEQEKQVMRDNAFRTYRERFTIERCSEEHLKLYNAALQSKLST